jgi:transcriptional regulator with XRE-family HTH domain
MTIGQKIKQLRLEHGLTQKQLGDAIGMADNTVHYWEQGDSDPHLYALIALADYFDLTLDELCGRGDKNVNR